MVNPEFAQINPKIVVEGLLRDGAVAVPFLSEEFRKDLALNMRTFRYSHQPAEGIFMNNAYGGRVEALNQAAERFVNGPLQQSYPNALRYPFTFNYQTFNRYAAESHLEGHIDTPAEFCEGLIGVVLVEGRSGLYYVAPSSDMSVFEDTKRVIPTQPGDLILTRGIGFMGLDTAAHEVINGYEPRYSVVLRHTS